MKGQQAANRPEPGKAGAEVLCPQVATCPWGAKGVGVAQWREDLNVEMRCGVYHRVDLRENEESRAKPWFYSFKPCFTQRHGSFLKKII